MMVIHCQYFAGDKCFSFFEFAQIFKLLNINGVQAELITKEMRNEN